MRAKLLCLTALAVAAMAGASQAQQAAAPPAPMPAPIQPSEPQPLAVYTPTHGVAATPEAPRVQPVFAVVGAHLVAGQQEPGAGRLTLMDETHPQFSCEVGHRGRLVQLACSDGSEALVTLGSFGCGHSTGGLKASLCVGFRARYAVQRLVAPPGQTLTLQDGHLALKPAAG